MTHCIPDTILASSPIRQDVHNLFCVPVLILELLQVLDSHVQHSPGQHVVKASATLPYRPAQGRDAATHILRHWDTLLR